VFFEELGMELDDVPGLGIQTHHVDSPGQGLEVGLRAGGLAEIIHHDEGIFVGVEIGGLEHGAAARLEMLDSRRRRRLDYGEKVSGKDPRPVNGLKPVPEGGAHEMDTLFHLLLPLFVLISDF